MTARLPRHVVKLGGSLLAADDLMIRLREWLAAEPAAQRVVVVGGGALVDEFRVLDRRHRLDERAAHWMCVDLMTVTSRVVASLLPEAVVTSDLADLHDRDRKSEVIIFDAADFLRHEEPRLPGTRLAESWDVTSDSIAARLAVVLAAEELVLLKSALPPSGCDVAALAEFGYVDRFFPRLWDELPPVRCVNLLDAAFIEAFLGERGTSNDA
ncbi:MAG: hypothetical protein WDZ59_14750 [Pirellulales bacterium]